MTRTGLTGIGARAVFFLLIAFMTFQPGSAMAQDAPEGSLEQAFPDYQPKTTPDTVLDYRPALMERLGRVLPAEAGRLPELTALLADWQARAKENPGRWVPGHPGLGADEKEYEPSDDELASAFVGDRIREIVEGAAPGEVEAVLQPAGVEEKSLEYETFTFRHSDVMGSGRYFYASPPQRVRLSLY